MYDKMIYSYGPSLTYGYSKNTGAWKGRLESFFVDLYPVELAKNGTNII